MSIDPIWLLLLIVTVGLGFATQAYIGHQYKKWSARRSPRVSSGLTGAQMARQMLDMHGLHNVQIKVVPGEMSDHFDPRTNVVGLSAAVHNEASVSATAIAAHECGHAIQHAQGFAPAKFRSVLAGPVSIASNAWMFVFLGGVFLISTTMGPNLIWLGIILYAAVIFFQLVTLPVEFDASRRAMAHIDGTMRLEQTQAKGARSVLTAAALTYVAAALVAILNLLYMLRFLGSGNE